MADTFRQKKTPLTRDVISILLIICALVIFALVPSGASAAKVTFEPNSIAVVMSPGEEKQISFAAELSETTTTSTYARFYTNLASGSISRNWVSRSNSILLNGSTSTTNVTTTIAVPSEVEAGSYVGLIRPVGLRSNERTTSNTLTLYLEVVPRNACSQAPVIADVTAGESIVRASNNKPLVFSFNGSITSPEGCTTGNAWYAVTDEYGEMDKTAALVLNDAGKFTVDVEVLGSRKGNDKDGRLYTVSFGAENEAGISVGAEQRIIISHNNRKK